MKKMSSDVFQKIGYIQEMNRLFLNQLGLKMQVDENNNLEILDFRDNKEGVVLSNLDEYASATAELLHEDYHNRGLYRLLKYGWVVQPLTHT